MSDQFENHASGLDSPGSRHFAITPGASPLAVRPRAIFCGGTGSITVTDEAGTSVQYTIAAAPYVLPFRGTHVTASDISNLVGWY